MSELENILEKCIGDNLPFCQATCPLHIDVKGYNALIKDGKYAEALSLIKEKLPFPGILGRVCNHPCELKCKRGEVDEPIAITTIKRAAADYGQPLNDDLTIAEEKNFKVAVIGSGPSGLMAAYDLRKLGYKVTVFEALPVIGGMLTVGIPDYRLPKNILEKDIFYLKALGIEFKNNVALGKDITLNGLFDSGYHAIFIGIGNHQGKRLPIPGADLEGTLISLPFLKDINTGKKVKIGKRVVVLGGGNVAFDCARSAIRLGAEKVNLACLESGDKMLADPAEIEEGTQEGIVIHNSSTFNRILEKNGKVAGVECQRLKSMYFDADGQLHTEIIPGSEFVLKADTVIFAIGQGVDTGFLKGAEGISMVRNNLIAANPVTLETNLPGIFAGGDAVYGSKSVIEALAAGRKAAISIDRYVQGRALSVNRDGEGALETNLKVNIEGKERKKRISMPEMEVNQRITNFKEMGLGFSREQAKAEAERCLQCECKLCVKECEFLSMYCDTPRTLAEKFQAGDYKEHPAIPYSCNTCGLCKRVCPEELNIGEMCLAVRQQMVDSGLGPLRQHNFVKTNVEWATSDNFALTLPGGETTKRVFFPGCSLSGYSPDLVAKTYEYLHKKLPGTGILLHCCGSPYRELGQQSEAAATINKVLSEIEKVGATEVIAACPNCYRMFKLNKPDSLKLTSLYEALAEIGVPDEAKTGEAKTFTIHDSCSARYETNIQDSVRKLLSQMGYQNKDMQYFKDKTRCCGTGGLVPYADAKLALKIAQRRVIEAPADIITYCATCRETMAGVEDPQKPILHILDLLFNPEWKQKGLATPCTGKAKRENQAKLKNLLLSVKR